MVVLNEHITGLEHGQLGQRIEGLPDAEMPSTFKLRVEDERDSIERVDTQVRNIFAIPANMQNDTTGVPTIESEIGFKALSLIVNNPTPFWFAMPDIPIYIPPYCLHGVYVFAMAPQKARIQFLAPPDATQPAITPGSIASFTFIDKALQPSVGSDSAAATGGSTVAISQAVPGTSNGVQIVAALPAGANVVGKVGIDQTTPGNTNGVQVVAALPAGANVVGNVGIDQTTPGTTNGVQVVAALPAGANVVGKVGIDQTTPGTTNAVQTVPGASGGLTPHHKVAAATNNATSLKATPGQVYSLAGFCLVATPRYLKLYDKASAPAPATDTPVLTYMMPGNTAGAGFVLAIPDGAAFASGIAYAIVQGIGDTDNTACAASDCVIDILYK